MSLYVYHQSEFVPARRYVDVAFAANNETRELVAALTADIGKQLSDDTLRLRLPPARHHKDLQLVWEMSGEYVGVTALIDETLGKSEPPLAAPKAARLKEIKRLTEIAQHFAREYAPEDVSPNLEVVAPPLQIVVPGAAVDTFVLQTASGEAFAGTLNVASVVVTGPGGASIPIGSFGIGGQTLATLSDVNSALTGAASPVTVTVGYTVPAGPYAGTIVDELTATLTDETGVVTATYTVPAISTIFASPPIAVSGKPAEPPANPGSFVTDVFTFANVSDQAGNFIVTPAQITGPAGPIAPAGYVFPADGPPASQQTYLTIQALQAALPAVPAGNSIQVGATYEVPDANAGQLVFCSFGASFSALGQTSEPETAFVCDVVVPAPSAIVAAPPVKQTVAPATTCTDVFTLINTSGQPATFSFAVDLQLSDAKKNLIRDVPGRHFTAFGATRQSDSTQITPTNLSDFNEQLASFPIEDRDTLAVTVSYKVPDGTKGDSLIDTLTVTANAGNSAATLTPITATNVLGSAIDVLGQIVVELNATYHLATLPASVPARLQQLNEEVRDFVNDGAPIAPTTHDFAHALAVHDLVDALYGRLIGDERPAPRIDEVP